jgi:hypothetical protein
VPGACDLAASANMAAAEVDDQPRDRPKAALDFLLASGSATTNPYLAAFSRSPLVTVSSKP